MVRRATRRRIAVNVRKVAGLVSVSRKITNLQLPSIIKIALSKFPPPSDFGLAEREKSPDQKSNHQENGDAPISVSKQRPDDDAKDDEKQESKHRGIPLIGRRGSAVVLSSTASARTNRRQTMGRG